MHTGTAVFVKMIQVYTTDERSNSFYADNSITLSWSNGNVVKVHGNKSSKYLKPRTEHIAVRLNGNDDHALATMDSLAMRRTDARAKQGLGPVLTHVHVDVETTGGRDVNEVRTKAKKMIRNFVRLMNDRGTNLFYWVIDGFYPKDPDYDTMSKFIEWEYNPSK